MDISKLFFGRKLIFFVLIFFLISFAHADQVVESNVSVVIDGAPPFIEIFNPMNMNYRNDTFLMVDYNVSDQSAIDSVWYWLNGGTNKSIAKSNFSKAFYLDLAEDSYILRIYANDSFGFLDFSEVSFTVDNFLSYCGDGRKNQDSEQCDGADLNAGTCASVLGDYEGTLACTNECKFDTTRCTLIIGNVINNNQGGGGGGGGGGAIAKPVNKTNLTFSEGGEEAVRIELGDNISLVDIKDGEKVVIVDIYGNEFEISFVLSIDGKVIAKMLNGDYIVPRDDVLPIAIGEREMYLGVESSDTNGAKIVLGMDANAVREYINPGLGNIINNIKNNNKLLYYVLIGIVGILVLVIIVLAVWYFVGARKKEKGIEEIKMGLK